jgi:hypothetical protein
MLTRRRSDDPHRESWTIFYDDVRVGTIGKRAGVPVDVDQWGWSCGFYPGQHCDGTTERFDLARAAFGEAWQKLLPNIPEGAFDEWRSDRAHRAEIRAKRFISRRIAPQNSRARQEIDGPFFFDVSLSVSRSH